MRALKSPGSKSQREGSLAGVSVVITRPAATARSAIAAARSRGAVVVALPGMLLRAARDVDAVREKLRTAVNADIWFFASPAAVRFAFRAWPDFALPNHTCVIAPGAGTRKALARRGIAAIAPRDRRDSEGVLALSELSDVRGRRVVSIAAPAGRDVIVPGLRARGALVDIVDVYERVAPRLTCLAISAFVSAAEPRLALLSSGFALRNLLAALPEAELARWRRQPLIVSSARLGALASEHGFDDLHVAASAAIGDLLDTAAAAVARRRR